MNSNPHSASTAATSPISGLRHRLLLYPPEQPALQLALPPTADWLIGREADCALRLTHPSVSRRHARLTACAGADADESHWRLEDLGSKNGTRCFTAEVAPEGTLAAGDWFAIGDVLGTIEAVPAERLDVEEQRSAQRRVTSQVWGTRLAAVSSRYTAVDPVAVQPHLSTAEALIAELLRAVVDVAEASRAFLVLLDRHGGWRVRACHGLAPDALARPAFSGSRGALQRVLGDGHPLYFSRQSDPARLGKRASVILGGIEALACLPLHADGRLVGAIYADSRQPGRSFDSLDAELLGALVDQASSVLVALELDDTLSALQRWLAVEGEGAAAAPAGPAPTLASLGIAP